MNKDLQRFISELLPHFPFLASIWQPVVGEESECIDIHALEESSFTQRESIICDIVLSIWQGEARNHRIDFTDLVMLSKEQLTPLLAWLDDPYCPQFRPDPKAPQFIKQ